MTRPDYCPVANEPCQAMCGLSDVRCKIRDFKSPRKREWVGLTDEDMYQLRREGAHHLSERDFRAIEVKLKEKNCVS